MDLHLTGNLMTSLVYGYSIGVGLLLSRQIYRNVLQVKYGIFTINRDSSDMLICGHTSQMLTLVFVLQDTHIGIKNNMAQYIKMKVPE